MKYDFDEVIERKNTGSLKWDFCEKYLGEKEVLPMWVADMDFRAPQPVVDAVTSVAQLGVYGYGEESECFYDAAVDWIKRRHGWTVKREWVQFCPGVVPALHLLTKTFADAGDKVIVQPPVYYPFFYAINYGDCVVLNNPLKLIDGKYAMDFDDLEKKMDQRVKMIFLCSPHNPGGMVWSREDLIRLGEICLENNVIVVSDEIHGDLILDDNKHIPFASLSEEFAMNSITCVAPSKTFNLAGLQVSNIIIPNPELAKAFGTSMEKCSLTRPNIFAIEAAKAAYNYGDEWLDQLIEYVEDNHRLLEDYIEEKIPLLKVIKPQASYLAWIDCRSLGLDNEELKTLMDKKARLGLNQGYIFGQGGEGFVRMNLGCPRAVVREALQRLEQAVNAL
jgi:cysteine-S-conjugate beta-lyase